MESLFNVQPCAVYVLDALQESVIKSIIKSFIKSIYSRGYLGLKKRENGSATISVWWSGAVGR